MVMTIVSGEGCWTSMFPPPVWVHPDRTGVTLLLREPSDSDTSGAGAWVVTVMFTGWPGWPPPWGWPPAPTAGTNPAATVAPRSIRRLIRLITPTSVLG